MSTKRPHKVYRLKDGERVPSVTTVIGSNLAWGSQSLLGWVRKKAIAHGEALGSGEPKMLRDNPDPNEIRDAAGRFGTIVHAKIEAREQRRRAKLDGFDPKEVAAADRVYKKYLAWRKKHDVDVVASERELISESLRYGGTVDLVMTVDGVKCLPDIKTSNHMSVQMRIQLAAYQQLWAENYGEDLLPMILWLPKHQKGPLKPFEFHDLTKEWEVFKTCLRLHYQQKEMDPFEFEDVYPGGQ